MVQGLLILCKQFAMKDLEFRGDSGKKLGKFPEPAKQRALLELKAIREGDDPSDWRPMPSVGAGVIEIRIRAKRDRFRIFYVAKFEEAIYVLHAFQKKSQKTAKPDIEKGRKRYKDLIEERKRE